MDIAYLLNSPRAVAPPPPATTAQPPPTPRPRGKIADKPPTHRVTQTDILSDTISVMPTSQRKRRCRLSVSQILDRRAYQDYESKVFNLTLDVNQLRQQVQYLMECRDLYLTRLFLSRQQLEGDVLGVVEKLVNGFSKKGPSLSSNQRSRLFSSQHMTDSRNAGVHDLVLERGTHIFSHRSWTTTSARVTYFVEEEGDEDTRDAAEIRRLCGDSNGCVVETVGLFTGRIKYEMIAGFYPHALGDEALVARLIGYSITCPVRLVFYFDEQRSITHQVAQVDVMASMKPLQQERPNDFAILMGEFRI